METVTNTNQTKDMFKKSILEIRSMKKIPKETINNIQHLSDENKMEIIKELISSHNYMLVFYQNHQNND